MPPVEDHEVHELVKIGSDWRYGCNSKRNSRSRRDGYLAPDGYALGSLRDTREVQMTFVKNVMSQECRFEMSLRDPACEGCLRRGSGEAYDQKVRNAAEGR